MNVVKYKLDHIRKKLEMEERDQTSRASFICHYCQRSYTDLEVCGQELHALFFVTYGSNERFLRMQSQRLERKNLH